MLTCRQLTELITEYLEGEMPFVRRAQFVMHLGMCRHCREYVRQMKTTIATLGALEPEQVPDHVRDELMKHFSGMLREPPSDEGDSETKRRT